MYLIIGASGFIGRHLYDQCKKNGIDVLGTYYTHLYNSHWIKFDICSDSLSEFCIRYLEGDTPDAIILCGGNGNIDSCKKDEKRSWDLNVIGIKNILDQAKELKIKCVFLSSEAVYDGKKGMYTEEDEPNPITVYGKQKLQIERYITCNFKDYLIFRISRAVGSQFGEKDIWDEFYNKMVHKEEIICLKNQSFCLTDIDDITNGILRAINQNIFGLFHLSSANYISRYELAQIYGKRIFGGYESITEKEYSSISFLDNRHIYGGLNGDKLERILKIEYKSINDILDKYVVSLNRLERKRLDADRKIFME